jgi:hypothetical protein
MKEVFIVWIIFQLLVIGEASIEVHNQVFNKTYECGPTKEAPDYIGYLVPLNAFVPTPQEVVDYCHTKDAL